VTDDSASTEDLSNGEDQDTEDNRELVIRWNLEVDNVNDYHVYVIENNEQKSKFLGRTGSGLTSMFIWNEESRVTGQFRNGPQDGSSYLFMVYAVRRGGPPAGPFQAAGPVLFTLGAEPTNTPAPEPTPMPVVENCAVINDLFSSPVTDLTEVDLGLATLMASEIESGTSAPFSIEACGPNGEMGINLPAMDSNAIMPAALVLSSTSCGDGNPIQAKVTLQSASDIVLQMVDSNSNIVATAQIAGSTAIQDVTFDISASTKMIEIIGNEVCVLSVCVSCQPSADEPTDPVATPAITPTPSNNNGNGNGNGNNGGGNGNGNNGNGNNGNNGNGNNGNGNNGNNGNGNNGNNGNNGQGNQPTATPATGNPGNGNGNNGGGNGNGGGNNGGGNNNSGGNNNGNGNPNATPTNTFTPLPTNTTTVTPEPNGGGDTDPEPTTAPANTATATPVPTEAPNQGGGNGNGNNNGGGNNGGGNGGGNNNSGGQGNGNNN